MPLATPRLTGDDRRQHRRTPRHGERAAEAAASTPNAHQAARPPVLITLPTGAVAGDVIP